MRELAAAAALLALVGVTAGTYATASSTAEPGTFTLVAVEMPGSEVAVDVGKKGESPGDAVLFSETLLREGRKTGRTDIMCVFARTIARCNGTLTLPGGTIEAGGGIRFARTFSVPVLGGTGTYAGARGVLRITELSDRRSRYVVQLMG